MDKSLSKKRRINCTGFSVKDLDKLEYIKDGNLLPNFDWFVKHVMNKDGVDDLFALWLFTNKQIGAFTNNDKDSFNHELGTILISCKEWSGQLSHGSKYGSLVVTTYQNNAIPNLYEVSVSWPNYSHNPMDILESEV